MCSWSYLGVEVENCITLQGAFQPTLARALRLEVLLEVVQGAESRVTGAATNTHTATVIIG